MPKILTAIRKILIANSTLPTGTAWQHLNSQGGGGGTSGIIVNDGIDVEVDTVTVEIELDASALEIETADAPVTVEFANESIVLEVEEW